MTTAPRGIGLLPLVCWEEVPTVTAAQMAAVDRVATQEVGLALPVMMENAGRHLAALTRTLHAPERVTVLVGPGGNGGGGLVAARHLANRGVQVDVVLASEGLHQVTRHQLGIVQTMDISIGSAPPTSATVVVDALLGYSLRGRPRGRFAELIAWANNVSAPVVALDAPSGLDVTTGAALGSCVHADATLTVALPKPGLLAAPQVGRLFLADIGIPAVVYSRLGLGSAVLPADLVELVGPVVVPRDSSVHGASTSAS